MDALLALGGGMVAVFDPVNLLALVVGLLLGLLVAVLPGLNLVTGVVLALPFTYGMGVTPGVILLTSMYVAGTYGGALTAILFRIPGEPMDVPLLWDGYPMSRRGDSGRALGLTLLAAVVGGLFASTAMVAVAQPVASLALMLSSPEYFAIILFGLASVVCLGGASMTNALVSLGVGLFVATIGTDAVYGAERFAYGLPVLLDGIDYLIVMVGAYGIAEILSRLHAGASAAAPADIGRLTTRLPGLREVGALRAVLARSSLLGFGIGLVPGAGATIASFVSYGVESQSGRNRAMMGKGAPEGIVAPQTAATASVGGAMVPLLTLGIPGSGATAIILGAFLLHGVQPGPQVFFSSSGMVFTIFASIFVAVIGMGVIGYFFTKGLVRILRFPEPVVSAFVAMFCFLGALATRNNVFDVWLMLGFGVLGFLFERFRFPVAPLVLGVILGPLAENHFMTTMISFGNDWTVFLTRPISAAILALAGAAVLYPSVARAWRLRRARAG
jgi:putative tricarboxylic transport membrane protein